MIPPALLGLLRAAATGRPVRVGYREAALEPSRPEVEVLSVGWRFGGWVALARSQADGGLRVLEVKRVAWVRPAERRRRPRGSAGWRDRPRGEPPPGGVDPIEFALADLQAPEAGPVRRVAVLLPRSLAPLAGVLFAGAAVEDEPPGARVRLRATDLAALSRMAASLGARLG